MCFRPPCQTERVMELDFLICERGGDGAKGPDGQLDSKTCDQERDVVWDRT
jgi:hypothetical protein